MLGCYAWNACMKGAVPSLMYIRGNLKLSTRTSLSHYSASPLNVKNNIDLDEPLPAANGVLIVLRSDCTRAVCRPTSFTLMSR